MTRTWCHRGKLETLYIKGTVLVETFGKPLYSLDPSTLSNLKEILQDSSVSTADNHRK